MRIITPLIYINKFYLLWIYFIEKLPQGSKLPIITEIKKQRQIVKQDLENLEISMHKTNISRCLDQAMKIYDAIKLMKGQLTTYGNNFNFKNDRYLLNAFIEWKNSWHNI